MPSGETRVVPLRCEDAAISGPRSSHTRATSSLSAFFLGLLRREDPHDARRGGAAAPRGGGAPPACLRRRRSGRRRGRRRDHGGGGGGGGGWGPSWVVVRAISAVSVAAVMMVLERRTTRVHLLFPISLLVSACSRSPMALHPRARNVFFVITFLGGTSIDRKA